MDALKNITWTKHLGALKDFKIENLKCFLHPQGVTDSRENSKAGYKLFIEGLFHDVEVEQMMDENSSQFSVRAKCHDSQKRKEKANALYFTFFKQDMQLKECYCSCTVELSQSCPHLIGLGFLLQDLVFREVPSVPEEASRTSSSMSCPTKRKDTKIEPEDTIKSKRRKIYRKRKPVRNRQFVPRMPFQINKNRESEIESLKKFVASLKKIDPKMFAYLIDPENQDESMTTLALQRAHPGILPMDLRGNVDEGGDTEEDFDSDFD